MVKVAGAMAVPLTAGAAAGVDCFENRHQGVQLYNLRWQRMHSWGPSTRNQPFNQSICTFLAVLSTGSFCSFRRFAAKPTTWLQPRLVTTHFFTALGQILMRLGILDHLSCRSWVSSGRYFPSWENQQKPKRFRWCLFDFQPIQCRLAEGTMNASFVTSRKSTRLWVRPTSQRHLRPVARANSEGWRCFVVMFNAG